MDLSGKTLRKMTKTLSDGTKRVYYCHSKRQFCKTVTLRFKEQTDVQHFNDLIGSLRKLRSRDCSFGALFTKVVKERLYAAERYINMIDQNTGRSKVISKSMDFYFTDDVELAAFKELWSEVNQRTVHFGHFALLLLEDFLRGYRELPAPELDKSCSTDQVSPERKSSCSLNGEIDILEKKLKSALSMVKSLSTRLSKCICGQRTWSDFDFEMDSCDPTVSKKDPQQEEVAVPTHRVSPLSPIENLMPQLSSELISPKPNEVVVATDLQTTTNLQTTESDNIDANCENIEVIWLSSGSISSNLGVSITPKAEMPVKLQATETKNSDIKCENSSSSGMDIVDFEDAEVINRREGCGSPSFSNIDQEDPLTNDATVVSSIGNVSTVAAVGSGNTFACKDCHMTFSSFAFLSSHQKRHSGEYRCEYPDCTFAGKSKLGLIKHQNRHTGEKSFLCSACGKQFHSPHELLLHNRIHTNIDRYMCPTCGKDFTNCSGFNRHLRTHTGEKPFSCSTCGRCFNRPFNLRAHQRTHNKELPYSCRLCSSSFKQLNSLNWHEISVHQKPHPYSCAKCGKGFVVPSRLKAHKCSLEGAVVEQQEFRFLNIW